MNLKKKLAVFLAILFSLNLFAQAPGETITISFQNIPLSEAIKKIESVSKYTFFYDALKLNVDQKVSLNAQKTPIQQAISQMLGNSGIKFEIKQSQIILYNKNVSSDEKKISIRGNVTDVNGEPLIGVTVSVKDNPSIVTITNVDGIYDIKVPDKSAILQFKYIGFASREEAVNSRKIIQCGVTRRSDPTRRRRSRWIRSTEESIGSRSYHQCEASTITSRDDSFVEQRPRR